MKLIYLLFAATTAELYVEIENAYPLDPKYIISVRHWISKDTLILYFETTFQSKEETFDP